MISIYTTHLKGRKKPCIVLESGNELIVLATFRNESMFKLLNLVLDGKTMLQVNGEDRTLTQLLSALVKQELIKQQSLLNDKLKN